jgi:hypothetical protein
VTEISANLFEWFVTLIMPPSATMRAKCYRSADRYRHYNAIVQSALTSRGLIDINGGNLPRYLVLDPG